MARGPEWDVVEQWATEKLERALRDLEATSLEYGATQVARGRIEALRELLALNRDPVGASPSSQAARGAPLIVTPGRF